MSGLESIKVLVVRPKHQLMGLCHAIRGAGGVPIALPLLDIVGPADTNSAQEKLKIGRHAGLWIFTSPNAVMWSATLSPPTSDRPWPRLLAAVGRGTANALREYVNASNILVPTADGAEALLTLPQLQNVAGRTVLIVRGERPLPLLEDRLRTLGAIVLAAEVYRRMPRPANPDEVAKLIATADAAIVTSGESLRMLRRVTPASTLSKLLGLPLVVPSMRVVKIAMEMGFRHQPLLPDRVSDDEFVRALLRWSGRSLTNDANNERR